MPRARYHLLDVFTDRPFTGNPLAVFVDPPELTAPQMQTIARELNLSETVFVHPPSGDTWPTRIFTPAAELPFAGHPTVGTAVLLAELGLATDRVVLAEGVGPVEVAIERRPQGHAATLRTAQAPAYTEAPDRDVLAAALSIEPQELHSHLAEGVWSCGVPFCVVPVRDADVLARIRLDGTEWGRHLEHTDAAQLFPIAPLDVSLDRWRARMFAPTLGVAEDPATGSAAAAAAGLLAASRQLQKGAMHWVIEQGVEMGRPSELRVSLDLDGSEASAVFVGGDAVVVGEGELVLPAA
ncbi:MAG: PhzF family phenazine biosynthesis protein [Acidimicrobiales bacterium]